jgi:type IV secretory pathway VirB4 component
MLPDIVDNTNFRFLKVNNKYIISISIKSLPENIYFLDIVKELPYNLDYDLSMYISKLDPVKTLNDITFNIGIAQSELNTINKNQRNIDVISKSKEDAAMLRKKIQVENQEIYSLSLILTFYSNDFNQILNIISSVKAKFYSRGICTETTNFRNLEFYLSNLPLNKKYKSLLNNLYITTGALANIFPFYVTNFIDENGIILGYNEKRRICTLDIFSNKYENSNMCIFGCSGSGKSYFTKLLIIRNFFYRKKQIIFDVEEEYEKICSNLIGQVVFKDTYYNIFQFSQEDLEKENFFMEKVERIISFISNFCNLNKEYLKKEIIRLYAKFNITTDKNSLYKKEDKSKVFLEYKLIDAECFPTLKDLIDNMEEIKEREILKNEVNDNLKYFSKTTNIDLDNMLYVIKTSEIIQKPKLLEVIIQYILDKCLGKTETIIYIDELWKYAKDEKILNSIFNMYKTIRKRKASIVTITQEVTDFFEYKEGMYGNSILNNSCFKILFKNNINDGRNLTKNLNIEEEKISFLKKGEAILIVDRNNIKIKVKANEFEREIINEDDFSNKK